MELDDALINSCRVCQSADQDGDFEWLYKENLSQLSRAGQLYEELLGTKIDFVTAAIYPQYLCNSCDLQMRLFKKLRLKAKMTLETLDARNAARFDLMEKQEEEEIEENEFLVFNVKKEVSTNLEVLDELNVDVEDSHSQYHQTEYSTINIAQNESEEFEDEVTKVTYQQLIDDANKEQLEILEDFEGLEDEMLLEQKTENCLQNNEYESASIGTETYEISGEVENMTEEAISQSNMLEATDVDLLQETAQETAVTPADDEYMEVHYLDESCADESEYNVLIKETEKKPEHKAEKKNYCRICEEHYLTKADFMKHKRAYHSTKYPCAECGKVFQSSDAHNVHQKLHWGEPAFRCELCSKTFNQKVHYNYHMAKHNNIRNFKCEICGKAFIAKGDLAIHMRTHTGDRRYSCDICHKEFLLLVHMKNHRYSHFEKKFECKICNQMFVSPSTLRTHTTSIHENEPRFQCSFCVKKFRRKHHLLTHYKVHQKQMGSVEFTENLINCDEETLQDENSQVFVYVTDLPSS